jgi:hypothetical protein
VIKAALSKPTAAATRGAVVFGLKVGDSTIRSFAPRVRRAATLDGGAVIDHRGYSDGDRTIEIRGAVDLETADDLSAMVQEATFLILHTPDGSYYGAVSDFRVDRGDLKLTFLAQEAA